MPMKQVERISIMIVDVVARGGATRKESLSPSVNFARDK